MAEYQQLDPIFLGTKYSFQILAYLLFIGIAGSLIGFFNIVVLFTGMDTDDKRHNGGSAQYNESRNAGKCPKKGSNNIYQCPTNKHHAQKSGDISDALYQRAKVDLKHSRFLLVIHSTGHACIYYTAFLCPNLTPTRKFFLPHINFVNIHKNPPQHLLNIVFFNLFKIPLDML